MAHGQRQQAADGRDDDLTPERQEARRAQDRVRLLNARRALRHAEKQEKDEQDAEKPKGNNVKPETKHLIVLAIVGLIAWFVIIQPFLEQRGWWHASSSVSSYGGIAPGPPVAARTDDGWVNHPPGMHPHGAYRCTKQVHGQTLTGWCW